MRQFAGSVVSNFETYLTTELDESICFGSINDNKWGRKDTPPGHYHGDLNSYDKKWGKKDLSGHSHIIDESVEDIVMVSRCLFMDFLLLPTLIRFCLRRKTPTPPSRKMTLKGEAS